MTGGRRKADDGQRIRAVTAGGLLRPSLLSDSPLPGGSDKQAAQSWGATEGNAELEDEQAGEAMAESEKKARPRTPLLRAR
ncbi:hypothetical protein MKX08_003462 [Trichoderma sp. CBMAI-0020]|nr:hypothetical protein MKX08_003462 [Trichoderma sp. CBMAI-0020]